MTTTPDLSELTALNSRNGRNGWLARKALYPDIGGVVLDLWLDDDGMLARMKPELVRYRTRENDWDYEVSASVSRGWSPEGLVR